MIIINSLASLSDQPLTPSGPEAIGSAAEPEARLYEANISTSLKIQRKNRKMKKTKY